MASEPMNLLILGATSRIAQDVARLYAKRGTAFLLVGRDAAKLDSVSADLKVRGAKLVGTLAMDLSDSRKHGDLVAESLKALGRIDGVLIAHGFLGNQGEAEKNYSTAFEILNVNFLSVVSVLTPIANYFESERRGFIAVIGSVAGDRGRQSNYLYGTAKGALAIFLQGLRNRLFRSGVRVLTIKPGFVDTPMTASIPKGPLFAKPETVARGIVRAIDKGKDVVYLPFFWIGIMAIIKTIPERIFKRLKL